MTDERSGALASELRRRGLDAPALVLLIAHRPIRPLLSNLAIFLSPLARPFAGGLLSRASHSLETDAQYDGLIRELEEGEAKD